MSGKVVTFFRNWYRKGVYAPPPICMKSKTLRAALSANECCGCPCSCAKVGKWGYAEFGEKYRAEIMFWAFWASFAGMVLLAIPFASLSTNGDTIRDTNWASFSIDQDSSLNTISHFHFYLGLRETAVTCSGDACPYDEKTYSLDSNECSYDFCQDCAAAASGTETGAFLGFITMIVQLSGDLTRSRRSADMNCQKFMGMLTALLGFVTTLSSLSNFSEACYKNIPDSHQGVSIHPVLGPAFWCTFVSALLKLVDVAAHWVVPSPPAGEGYEGSDSRDAVDEESSAENAKKSSSTLKDKLLSAGDVESAGGGAVSSAIVSETDSSAGTL